MLVVQSGQMKSEMEKTRQKIEEDVKSLRKETEKRNKEESQQREILERRVQELEEKIDTGGWELGNSRLEERIKVLERLTDKVNNRNREVEWERLREEENQRMQEIKQTLDRQEQNLRTLEKKSNSQRRKNIVIKGLQKGNSVHGTVENFLREALQIETKVINAYQVGRNDLGIFVAELESMEVKSQIMRKKYMLRGSEIYIDDDLLKNEREIQKIIREYAKTERDKNRKVKIGYKKICIDDVWYKWNETEGRPEGENVFLENVFLERTRTSQ